MLNITQSVLIGVAIVAGSLGFLLVLDRAWPAEERRQHNDIVGWQVSVVGMTYAVILGFMLYAVWTGFELAKANADAEANALVNLSRLATGLPEAQRDTIQAIAKHYADAMVDHEWPLMRQGAAATDSQLLTQQLWAAIVVPQGLGNAAEQTTVDHTVTELTSLTEHRRLRQLESRTGLPGILWTVLIVGAIITIASSCLFGTKNSSLHFLQVLGLSILVALTLIAIAEIDRPFQGDVHVSPEAFIHAQQSLQAGTPQS